MKSGKLLIEKSDNIGIRGIIDSNKIVAFVFSAGTIIIVVKYLRAELFICGDSRGRGFSVQRTVTDSKQIS